MVAVESCLYDSVLKSGEPGRICVSLTIPPNNCASGSRPCLSPGLAGSARDVKLFLVLRKIPDVHAGSVR